MRRFHWRYVICLGLAAYVLADVFVLRGPLHRWTTTQISAFYRRGFTIAARVYDEKVTLLELQEAMRDHLWRRGEEWAGLSVEQERETRAMVIERLVNERLIRAGRLKEPVAERASVPMAADELAVFARQFHPEGDFERRLALQHLTEPELLARMRDAAEDQAWVESKIATRMAAVTEQDVSAWLRGNGASMALPARYSAAHIYLTTHDAAKPEREAEMREIHRKLAAGEATFEQLALEHSDDERSKKIGGALGWCARGRMPDDFMNAVEKLEEGETSGPVETKLGWHVIRLTDRKPARAPTTDEVKGEVMALLRDERHEAAVRELIAELRAQAGASIVLNQSLIDTAEPP